MDKYLPGMLGSELKNAREAAGLTQEQLGFRAEVDRTYISQLERDLKSPTLAMLFRLCDALSISAGELVLRVERSRAQMSKRSGRTQHK